MIEIRAVTKRFGGIVAVDAVDLVVPRGELHCLVGPNGAGKTTLLALLTGDLHPTSGEIWIGGRRTDGLSAHELARMGVMRKHQVPAVFPDLSVWENLSIAATGCVPLRQLLRADHVTAPIVDRMLERVRLAPVASTAAQELSHGQVQWLEIGMALITEPSVILLDEPTAGMTRAETDETAALLLTIAAEGESTMVVVEHDMTFVRQVADRVTVLHKGSVVAQGSIDDVEHDPQVREVYLGATTSEGASDDA